MLKKLVNEAYFTLRITTTGPLLIKSGHATVSGPDMTPVRTFRNKQEEVFLPGSSLKGVFRSHVEKIVCSLKPKVVCYPFFSSEDKKEDLVLRRQDYRDSCGAIFTELAKNNKDMRDKLDARTDYIYANSCPTCRLFGSTGFIGRLAISDAYLASESVIEQRDGVGIDRLTGGASHGAKFELEVVGTDVVFETDIHLRNFEIWQLGMLFAVLQDMQDELIRIGSGRSRGLGQVKAEISQQGRHGRLGGFVTSSLRRGENDKNKEPANQLWGLGRWLGDQSASYGTQQNDLLQLEETVKPIPHGIRNLRVFEGEALNKLQNAAIEAFIKRMQDWPKPEIPLTLNNR